MMLLFSLKMKSDYKEKLCVVIAFLLLNLILMHTVHTILTIVYAVPFRYLGSMLRWAVLLVVTWFEKVIVCETL